MALSLIKQKKSANKSKKEQENAKELFIVGFLDLFTVQKWAKISLGFLDL